MGFTCGIVGLPNIGKSTLFNAITKSQVEASNYPFCTIEPNKGIVSVLDERLSTLGEMSRSKKIFPTVVEFVDIAGLVSGASQGEGLGNQFLSHIREVKAICQVVRIFDDENITHIGEVDPIRDVEIINTELMLADLDSVEKRIQNLERKAKSKDKEAQQILPLLQGFKVDLEAGKMLNTTEKVLDISNEKIVMEQQLITTKPMLIVANIREDRIKDYMTDPNYIHLKEYCERHSYGLVALCAKMEGEMSELDEKSIIEFMEMEGLEKRGLDELISKSYELLDLITFFTTGEKESRAWTVRKNTLAPSAAGVIHSDFERGFIKAETISYEDFKNAGGYSGSREAGKLRLEGKSYVVEDGDIMVFKFNV